MSSSKAQPSLKAFIQRASLISFSPLSNSFGATLINFHERHFFLLLNLKHLEVPQNIYRIFQLLTESDTSKEYNQYTWNVNISGVLQAYLYVSLLLYISLYVWWLLSVIVYTLVGLFPKITQQIFLVYYVVYHHYLCFNKMNDVLIINESNNTNIQQLPRTIYLVQIKVYPIWFWIYIIYYSMGYIIWYVLK